MILEHSKKDILLEGLKKHKTLLKINDIIKEKSWNQIIISLGRARNSITLHLAVHVCNYLLICGHLVLFSIVCYVIYIFTMCTKDV